MFHPLAESPKNLKDSDLESKITELSKKYFIASKMGQGAVASQIVSILEMYREEQIRRQYESTDKLIKKQNKDLDDLINVD
jgi:hypothetical protein